MSANPSKFQAIKIGNKNKDFKSFPISDNFEIETTTEVSILGIQIDDKLNFDKHVELICQKASRQLNALKRLTNYLEEKEKRILVNSFILCHFNYCPLVWLFCNKKSKNKIEKINERAQRIIHTDYSLNYNDLLKKDEDTTIHINMIRNLALEVYKTLNKLNPPFMQNLFEEKHTKYDLRGIKSLDIPKVNTTKYGIQSLKYLGPKIWNSLPDEVKLAPSANHFKTLTKTWFLENVCCCSFCQK